MLAVPAPFIQGGRRLVPRTARAGPLLAQPTTAAALTGIFPTSSPEILRICREHPLPSLSKPRPRLTAVGVRRLGDDEVKLRPLTSPEDTLMEAMSERRVRRLLTLIAVKALIKPPAV